MALNSKRDKFIALLMLVSMIALVVYQSTFFISGWAYHLDNKIGRAEVTKKYEKDGSRFIEYIYYNEYVKDSVRNVREVTNLKHWEKYISHQKFEISYAKYFSSRVIFESIDKEPLFLTRVFFFIVELFAIWLVIRVLRDKISLSTLAGVRGQDETDKEE